MEWILLGIIIIVIYLSRYYLWKFGVSFETLGFFEVFGVSVSSIYVKSLSLEFFRRGKLIIIGINSPTVNLPIINAHINAHIINSNAPVTISHGTMGNLKNKLDWIPFSLFKIFGIIVRDASVKVKVDDQLILINVSLGLITVEKLIANVALVELQVKGVNIKSIQEEVRVRIL